MNKLSQEQFEAHVCGLEGQRDDLQGYLNASYAEVKKLTTERDAASRYIALRLSDVEQLTAEYHAALADLRERLKYVVKAYFSPEAVGLGHPAVQSNLDAEDLGKAIDAVPLRRKS